MPEAEGSAELPNQEAPRGLPLVLWLVGPPAWLAAVHWVVQGSDAATWGLRIALYLLGVGAGLAPLLTRRASGRGLSSELLWLGFCAGLLCVWVGLGWRDWGIGARAALIGWMGWVFPWSLVGPLRVVTATRKLAPGAFGVAFGLLLATPYLVVPPGGRDWADLPAWVTHRNPIARLQGSVFGVDWFHGPLLYGQVGERPYRYPDALEGLPEFGIWVLAGMAATAWLLRLGARDERKVAARAPSI